MPETVTTEATRSHCSDCSCMTSWHGSAAKPDAQGPMLLTAARQVDLVIKLIRKAPATAPCNRDSELRTQNSGLRTFSWRRSLASLVRKAASVARSRASSAGVPCSPPAPAGSCRGDSQCRCCATLPCRHLTQPCTTLTRCQRTHQHHRIHSNRSSSEGLGPKACRNHALQ